MKGKLKLSIKMGSFLEKQIYMCKIYVIYLSIGRLDHTKYLLLFLKIVYNRICNTLILAILYKLVPSDFYLPQILTNTFLLKVILVLYRQQEKLLSFINNCIFYAYNSHFVIHLILKRKSSYFK